jgi:hypothetical protein
MEQRMKQEKTYRVESLGQLKVLIEGLNIKATSHKEAKEKADELITKLFARLSKETSHCFWTEYNSYSSYTQDFHTTKERTRHLHPNEKQVKFLEKWCGERAAQDFNILSMKVNCIQNDIEYEESIGPSDNEPTWGLDAMPCTHSLSSYEQSSTVEIEEFLNAPIGLTATTNKRIKQVIINSSKGRWVERLHSPELTTEVLLSE